MKTLVILTGVHEDLMFRTLLGYFDGYATLGITADQAFRILLD